MKSHALPAALVFAGMLIANGVPPGRSKAPVTDSNPAVARPTTTSAGSHAELRNPGNGLSRSSRVARSVARSKRPDFTGRWMLDMKRSEFGSIPGGKPLARTDTITHREPDIAHVLFLENPASRDTAVYLYRTTGETTHSTVDGRDVQSVAHWDGRTLAVDSKMKLMVFDVTLSERWELSVNRDTLKMTRSVKSRLASGDQRLIFARR